MLQSGLSLVCYTLPSSGNPVAVQYAQTLTKLSFTTVAPGGFGQLTADIRLPNLRDPHPELALFARVAVRAGTTDIWLGEIVTPLYKTNTDEIYTLGALGIGNSLRDDPRRVSYLNQTIAQILTAEFTARVAYLPLSGDLTLVIPGNPSATYSPAYDGPNLEEIVADLAILDGDDAWGVWAHATARDAAGFALGQLQLHARDTTTVHYSATLGAGEVMEQQVTPSADRAYNVVEIGYYDAAQAMPVGTAIYTDSRLNGDGSQGTAPFRRRKYYRDLSGISTVTKAQAQIIANTYGALYQNPTNANAWKLIGANDANGKPLELYRVQADHNIRIADAVYRSNFQNQISAIPTTTIASQNLFHIMQTTYTETDRGSYELNLQTDHFVDIAAIRIARLQLRADVAARAANKTTGLLQATGVPETGGCGTTLNAASASQTMLHWVSFRTVLSNTPTSITLTSGSSSNITGSASAQGITNYGFQLKWTATSAGATSWFGTYTTVGN